MNVGVCQFSVCGETPVMHFPICLSDCGWVCVDAHQYVCKLWSLHEVVSEFYLKNKIKKRRHCFLIICYKKLGVDLQLCCSIQTSRSEGRKLT